MAEPQLCPVRAAQVVRAAQDAMEEPAGLVFQAASFMLQVEEARVESTGQE